MSNKGTETALKQEINLNIIPNNQQQLITGAKLNVVLLDMVDTLMYLLGNGSGGAANYENLYNKPSINGYELNGEISLSALGLISSADIALAYQKRITESNKLAADYISGLAKVAISGDYNDLKNKPEISGGEVSNVSWGEQTATYVTLIVEGVGKTLLTPQALDNYVQASTLFENGVIRSTLLPSYVDDVLEYTSRSNFPSTGQAGKIYVALDTNKTYRWGGSTYVVISETIAIGTTAGTAYDGAAGKALADAVAGIPNLYYNKTEIDDILLGYVDDAQIASYYNKTEVDNKLKGYVTNAAFADSIDDYLTIINAENTYYKKTGGIISGGVTINGATTINNSLSVNSLKIGGISISVNSDGILFVEGTLATSGGLSVRGVSTGSGGGGSASLPAVWESLSGDRDEYKNVQINKSHLTAYLTATEVATSYATRGSLAALDERVTEIESSSTSVSYTPSVTSGQLLGTIVIDGKGSAIYAPSIAGLASESWVSNNFLGLGGGTILSAFGGLTIKRDAAWASAIKYENSAGVLGYIGINDDYNPMLWEKDAITGHTLLHSGNIGSYNAGSATKLQTARSIWGQSFDGTGNITGALQLDNNTSIYLKNTSGAYIDALRMSSGDGFVIGYGASAAEHNTFLEGANIHLRYGTSHTTGLMLNSAGNVLIGTTTDNGAKLNIAANTNANGKVGAIISATDTTSTTSYPRPFEAFYPNLPTDKFISLGFGVRDTARDAGFMTYYYAGQNSASNRLSFGLHSVDDVLNIMGSGNVGIGTTSPQYDLHVDGTMYGNLKMLTPRTIWGQSFDGTGDVSGAISGVSTIDMTYGSVPGEGPELRLNIQNRGTAAIIKGVYDSIDWSSSNPVGGSLRFYTANSAAPVERMRITPDGGVLIGTTTDNGAKLQVNGNITASGTIAGRSLSVTSVNQSSDRRLKKEESRSTPLTIEDVAQLNVRSYKWIDESMGKELQIGLYAQDVQTIIPEIVRENEQSKSLGLDYGVGGAVFGVLAAQSIVKQIKPALTEQQKRIVELEQRVEFLEKLTYGGK